MTGLRKIHTGELIALRPAQAGTDAAVTGAIASADLRNVVPFMRPRATGAHAPEITLPAEPARLRASNLTRERLRLVAFAALSLAVHGGLLAAFWREPEPLASIGIEVMSVEIVVGATAPAGAAQAPGENEIQAAAAPDPQPPEVQREAEQRATEQPQAVPVAPQETAPEQARETPVEPEPQVAEQNARPDEVKPREAVSATEAALLPPTEEKPAEPKAEPKPIQNVAPVKERRRIEAPTKDRAAKQANASTPSTAANNVGVGRSDSDSNYAGLVSAHLRRHQQYPADARSRGDQGTATVSFSLDGGGRVTSARLVRGSGIASIDSEVQAMVRRSSPFPAPPSGRSVSFTVPVSFRLN